MGHYLNLCFDTTKEIYDKEKLMDKFCEVTGAYRESVPLVNISPVGSIIYNSHKKFKKERKRISIIFQLFKSEPEKIRTALEKYFTLVIPFDYQLYDLHLRKYITVEDKEVILERILKWYLIWEKIKNKTIKDEKWDLIREKTKNETIKNTENISEEDIEFLHSFQNRDGFYVIHFELSETTDKWGFHDFQQIFTGLGLKSPELGFYEKNLGEYLSYKAWKYPIWFDVGEKGIMRGVWAYIRFSWSENEESFRKYLETCLEFAEKMGCNVCEEDSDKCLTKDNIDDFLRPFAIVKILFGSIEDVSEKQVEKVDSSADKRKSNWLSINDKISEVILKKLEQTTLTYFIDLSNLWGRAEHILRSLEDEGWSLRQVAEHYNKYGNFETIYNCSKKPSGAIVEELISYCNYQLD